MRTSRVVALVAVMLVLITGIAASVIALSMTSHVEPNSPHMVQRSVRPTPLPTTTPSSSATAEVDDDADDDVEYPDSDSDD